MNRIKNFIIIITLIIFLYIIAILPVTCIFKSVTGILCPACGMTRAFWFIMNFNFLQATYFNILSIPLFCVSRPAIITQTTIMLSGSK